jgi:Family of unknown function (DUF7009)
MKLRVLGDSIRLRLTRGEVAELGRSGVVGERTHFAGGVVMEYRLCRDAGVAACKASLEGNVLTVSAPASAVDQWLNSDDVAIRSEAQPANTARILVEKDFACLTERPGEDDSDAYPHPGTC